MKSWQIQIDEALAELFSEFILIFGSEIEKCSWKIGMVSFLKNTLLTFCFSNSKLNVKRNENEKQTNKTVRILNSILSSYLVDKCVFFFTKKKEK